MHTLLFVRDTDHVWLRELFGVRNPLLVPICNKPFIEFLIDFSILSGSRALRIVSDGRNDELEQYCGDGSRWGIALDYAHSLPSDDRDRILEKNRRFCTERRTLVIDGALFIEYDKRADYRSWFASLPEGSVLSGRSGSITLIGPPEADPSGGQRPPLAIPSIDSSGRYYELSNGILRAGGRYILPGYSNEADCCIGRNVVIQKGAEIRKPVMIGNNVQIMAGAVIGPGTVIGSNVIVDCGSVVSESILLDNTFVGESLDVSRKIASGNLLVDPGSGASLLTEDPHLISLIGQAVSVKSVMRQLVHGFAAAMLIVLLALPYIILRPLLALMNAWKPALLVCRSASGGKPIALRTATIMHGSVVGWLASRLSLDRFLSLFRVLDGSLVLIGHRPQSASDGNMLAENCLALTPAVFSYAEAEAWPEDDTDSLIVDHYYSRHSNPFRDISMTLKALFYRKLR